MNKSLKHLRDHWRNWLAFYVLFAAIGWAVILQWHYGGLRQDQDVRTLTTNATYLVAAGYADNFVHFNDARKISESVIIVELAGHIEPADSISTMAGDQAQLLERQWFTDMDHADPSGITVGLWLTLVGSLLYFGFLLPLVAHDDPRDTRKLDLDKVDRVLSTHVPPDERKRIGQALEQEWKRAAL